MNLRLRRWRFKWVVRVNFAGQKGQSFVCGSWGTFPLWERIRETVPSFLYSTLFAVGGGIMDLLLEAGADSIEWRRALSWCGGFERKRN